jgi:hypothetical protein
MWINRIPSGCRMQKLIYILCSSVLCSWKIEKLIIISKGPRGGPEAFKYAGGFERLDERSKLRCIGPARE